LKTLSDEIIDFYKVSIQKDCDQIRKGDILSVI